MSCEPHWRAYLAAEAKHEAASQALHKQSGIWGSIQEDLVPAFEDQDFGDRAALYEAAAAAQTDAVEKFARFYEHSRQHKGTVQHPGHDVAVS
ncbi:MAG: hypothetical protein WEB52_11510 [Dehalococcoidia bacterium]